MDARIYDTLEWALARTRALKRDGNRCTVARLLGGECSPCLDVHHLRPVSEGGTPYQLDNLLTACDSHHPMLESMRRSILRSQDGPRERPVRCGHFHRTAEGRRLCEKRMARQRELARSAA